MDGDTDFDAGSFTSDSVAGWSISISSWASSAPALSLITSFEEGRSAFTSAGFSCVELACSRRNCSSGVDGTKLNRDRSCLCGRLMVSASSATSSAGLVSGDAAAGTGVLLE